MPPRSTTAVMRPYTPYTASSCRSLRCTAGTHPVREKIRRPSTLCPVRAPSLMSGPPTAGLPIGMIYGSLAMSFGSSPRRPRYIVLSCSDRAHHSSRHERALRRADRCWPRLGGEQLPVPLGDDLDRAVG